LKISLQLVLVAVFVLMIVYFLRRYSADISGLQSLSLLDVLLICIWSFVSYTAYAYAVYAMLISAGLKDVDPYGWLRIYFVSRLVNFFVIQGGNLYRLVLLKNKYNFSYANSIGITAFLIWLNASIALLVSSYILATMEWRPGDFVDNLLVWSVAGLVILLLTPLLLVKSVTTFKCLATLPTKFLEPALKITDHFVATMKNRRLMMKITCLSCIHFFFFVGASYFSFRAIGQTVDVVAVCIFTTVFVFTRYINIVPGNIGLSELVGGLVSEQLGIGFGNGLLVSGIMRMIEILTIMLFGLFYGKFLLLEYFRNRPKED
jgi:uncharacterized membrane protein YbhN (UPF0104 family)